MKEESFRIEDVERKKFYYRLRMIFTYYAGQGQKQDPCVLRQNNFHKFLLDSTISELIQFKSPQKSGQKRKNIINSRKQNFEVVVNTINKPLRYQEFQNIITELIFTIRHKKQWLDSFENAKLQKDLFHMCQNDQIVSQIFKCLYEQIQQGTPFGEILVFSKSRKFYTQQLFTLLKGVKHTLKTIYLHYFRKQKKKSPNSLSDILGVLRKFCLQFQISPQILSMTDIFCLLYELISQRGQSIYEQMISEAQNGNRENQQWEQFGIVHFFKILILMAFLVQFQQNPSKQLSKSQISLKDYTFAGEKSFNIASKDQNLQTVITFLQILAISKGFKQIKVTYRISEPFLVRQSRIGRQAEFKPLDSKKSALISQKTTKNNRQLKFEMRKMSQSKSLQILRSVDKFVSVIFKHYQHDSDSRLMSQQSFDDFCSEFKIVPFLTSRRQIGETYLRVFSERNYFYCNNQTEQMQQEEDKLKIFDLISHPNFGLNYSEFLQILIYSSEIESICKKLNPPQRLIYWVQFIYNQPKTKSITQSLNRRTQMIEQDDINIDALTKTMIIRPSDEQKSADRNTRQNYGIKSDKNADRNTDISAEIKVSNNFHTDYQSMFQKLKSSLR